MIEPHMATNAMQAILKSIFDALKLAGSDVRFVTAETYRDESPVFVTGWQTHAPTCIFDAMNQATSWDGGDYFSIVDISIDDGGFELDKIVELSDPFEWIYPTPQEK